jgi:hypothetical protein
MARGVQDSKKSHCKPLTPQQEHRMFCEEIGIG